MHCGIRCCAGSTEASWRRHSIRTRRPGQPANPNGQNRGSGWGVAVADLEPRQHNDLSGVEIRRKAQLSVRVNAGGPFTARLLSLFRRQCFLSNDCSLFKPHPQPEGTIITLKRQQVSLPPGPVHAGNQGAVVIAFQAEPVLRNAFHLHTPAIEHRDLRS